MGGKEEEMVGSHHIHQYDTQQSQSEEDYEEAIKWPNHIQPSMYNQCKPSCTPTPSNGRGNISFTPKRPVLPPPATEGYASMVYPFSKEDYMKVVALIKTRKPLEEMMFWWNN